MRFEGALETDYRRHLLRLSLRARLLFGGLLLVIFTSYPLLELTLFHPPNAFTEKVRPLQFGLVVPLLLLLITASLRSKLHRLSTSITMVTIFAIGACVMYQRLLGHELGYVTATNWANITILASFFFFGLPLKRILPLASVLVVMNIATEFHIGQYTPSELNFINSVYEAEIIVICFVLGVCGCYSIETSNRLNWLEARDLQRKVLHDGLTGTFTRLEFRSLYRRLFSLAQREQRPISIAIADLDYFKNYNDHYGHAAGDQCLAAIGRVLRKIAKKHGGFVARIGGEEFVLLFYGASEFENAKILQSVRAAVENLAIEHTARDDDNGYVTMSIGSIHLVPDGSINRFAALKIADQNLYAAKERGRNQLALSEAHQYA
ncbi:diguanylate cyclase (GGDEF)-like protein [Litorivivens lipolytica]|uniref:diguanylate cyclase n=1 Tax=Litorivivens lipolytica TaxID=1524264 RepID=A0A7W4W6Z8_9GAMM|nr:GGDEF domain-containing protein [Litorivivens lipolytica]MBB3048607.1 diguanylate cyclase (GGDEF)-like protein [Litorivivens lipolytica]